MLLRTHALRFPTAQTLPLAARAAADDLMVSPTSARLALLATAKLGEWARHCRASLGGGGGGGGGALRPAPWAEALSEAARARKDALWDVLAGAASVRRHMMGGR